MNNATVCEKRHGDLVELQALQSDNDAQPLLALIPEGDGHRVGWCVS